MMRRYRGRHRAADGGTRVTRLNVSPAWERFGEPIEWALADLMGCDLPVPPYIGTHINEHKEVHT